MTPIKWLVRVGKRLQQAWLANSAQQPPDHNYFLNRLQQRQDEFQKAWQLLEKARGHNLVSIVPQLRAQLLQRLQEVRDAIAGLARQLEEPRPGAPSLSLFVAELQGLKEEFGDLHIDWKEKFLGVTTEPITLRDVELGPFSIQLPWASLAHNKCEARCFHVVALEPNPAASNDLVTHPHVKNQRLCPGDAAAPLQKALQEGRISDAFILIRSVLQHYNSGSPHVRLEDWFGSECHDCGSPVGDEERYYCEVCGYDYCEDCVADCSTCSVTRCRNCLTACEVCEDYFCSGCLRSSAHSGRDCCENCIAACARCAAAVARDELGAGSSLCPACQELAKSADASPDAQPLNPDTPNLEINDATNLESVACASP
jgi:hypothetical protein